MPFEGITYKPKEGDFERINEVMIREVFPELHWMKSAGKKCVLIRPLNMMDTTRGVLTTLAEKRGITLEEVGYWLDEVLMGRTTDGDEVNRIYEAMTLKEAHEVKEPSYRQYRTLANILIVKEKVVAGER